MNKISVIAIFDIGKTNKKLLLFDEQYELVHEESLQLPETMDEDGFACEDIIALTKWVKDSFERITKDERFIIKAANVSAYGASFVYLDGEGKVKLPLYNYLKPYPKELLDKFYKDNGGESLVGKQTASPSLGNLNSGLQLYRLKYEKPAMFSTIKYALHLPLYVSYLLSSKINSDITSIGCHTYLWNFQQQKYHSWVTKEEIAEKLPALISSTGIAGYTNNGIPIGVGLHDSSAALIPYLVSFKEPFILLSTGTWCVSLNPFNHSQLSDYELHNDCLCYLSYEGKPVKASRLFAGYEHEQQLKRLSEYFKTPVDYFSTVNWDTALLKKLNPVNKKHQSSNNSAMIGQSYFAKRELSEFLSYEQAYHQLIADIIDQQVSSTNLVLTGTAVKQIFVDGGFSQNSIYMTLLSEAFTGIEVYAASLPQASALGAAMAVSDKKMDSDVFKKHFSIYK